MAVLSTKRLVDSLDRTLMHQSQALQDRGVEPGLSAILVTHMPARHYMRANRHKHCHFSPHTLSATPPSAPPHASAAGRPALSSARDFARIPTNSIQGVRGQTAPGLGLQGDQVVPLHRPPTYPI